MCFLCDSYPHLVRYLLFTYVLPVSPYETISCVDGDLLDSPVSPQGLEQCLHRVGTK